MTRFLRVWLGFLGFTLAMLAVVAVIMLPGAVVIRYTDNLWFALGTTYLILSALWAWCMTTRGGTTLARRLSAFIASVERR
jgi:hypothetical protein